MNDEEYMQIYCAALTGLIAAQGQNDLLTNSKEILDFEEIQIPDVRFARQQVEIDQIDLFIGLTTVAGMIANHAREEIAERLEA
jgi:hypothetical protein